MSSLRNSLHRRNHKERSQLSNRKRLGILEKHKDYVQRAKDFNQKKEKVKRLKQKVADRNKDEFYFGMVGKHTKNGIHYQDRGQTSLPIDIVNVLKSQDEGYLRTTKTANLKRLDAIKDEISKAINPANPEWTVDLDEQETSLLEEIGLIAAPSGKWKRHARHLIFVEDESAANQYSPPQESPVIDVTHEVMEETTLGWKIPLPGSKPSKSTRLEPRVGDTKDATMHQDNELKDLLPELRARLQRDTHLRYALRELEMQRALMGKGTSRKVRAAELIKPDGAEDELNEDEQDALFGKRSKIPPKR